jgi:hypothetical protein
MGELHANCPVLNHVIEWVENVPVDARDTQVGSLDHRLVTRQQDQVGRNVLNSWPIPQSCRRTLLFRHYR